MAYTASCLCNGIQLRINAELEPIMVCHCKQCQKHKGLLLRPSLKYKKRFRDCTGENLCKRILHRLIKESVL